MALKSITKIPCCGCLGKHKDFMNAMIQKKFIRKCHLPAVKQLSDDTGQITTDNLANDNNKLKNMKKFYKAREPVSIADKVFHNDITYRLEEARLYPQRSFKYNEIKIKLAEPEQLKPKPDASELKFGTVFTDHMLKIQYHKALGGWQTPQIIPFQNISLHPASKAIQYAVGLFEGSKAYRGIDGRIRLFRPLLNMERMNASSVRVGLPTFDATELVKCIMKLIDIDQEWVPHDPASSLYIRPTLIGTDGALGVASSESAILYTILTPVGSYFNEKTKAVSLLADPRFTRAWPGGCGDRKLGSNYGPTLRVQKIASEKGHQQPMWLYGDDHQITEVGTMNIFIFIINAMGERELITPPLNGLILPGVVRHSIIQLCKDWNDFKVTERSISMPELVQLLNQNRVLEVFGCGTACVVSPVKSIEYIDQILEIPTLEHDYPLYDKILTTLKEIQYGYIDHPWAELIE